MTGGWFMTLLYPYYMGRATGQFQEGLLIGLKKNRLPAKTDAERMIQSTSHARCWSTSWVGKFCLYVALRGFNVFQFLNTRVGHSFP